MQADPYDHPFTSGQGGCIIDESQGSDLDLIRRVLLTCEEVGYEIPIDLDRAISGYRDGDWDAMESLDWTFENALTWLNDNFSTPGGAWFIMDNSLYYEHDAAYLDHI